MIACFIQRMGVESPTYYGKCLHTAPSRDHPHGRLRRAAEYNSEFVKKKQKDARMRSGWTSDRVGYLEKDTRYAHHSAPASWFYLNPQTSFEG
jgi:hypothetical protein